MRMFRHHAGLIFLLAGMVLAARVSFASSLEIAVRHTFGAEPLRLDSLRYQNAAGETLSITRLSYLLGGFALERIDGTWIELTNQTAWLDAAPRRTALQLENIPVGAYRSVRWHVGIETNANHADPAPLPADHPLNPNLNGLHWNWQGGYIFLAVEGRWQLGATSRDRAANPPEQLAARSRDAATKMEGFSFHFARDPNRTRISLTAELDLTHDAGLEIDFDLATLLNAPRPLSFVKDGSSTHSREGDPIAAALSANLPGAFRVRQILSSVSDVTKAAPVKPLYLPEKYTPYPFQMSGTFPIPDLPRDNPLIVERVALGARLFHETALSRDGSLSCASCHDSSAAFTDPRRFSSGVRAQTGTRNAMPLFNLAWKSSFFWDGRAPSLRAQVLMPIQDHVEMDETLTNVVIKLRSSRREEAHLSAQESQSLLTSAATNIVNYPALFLAAFASPEITAEKISLALEQFVLTLTSFDSKFDRALRGAAKFTEAEQRGFELFMTEYEPRSERYGADCFHCHGGPLFSDHQFHNNGLDAVPLDLGRFLVTTNAGDRGKFSTPSLRNIALTAPYMHDGRFQTLEEVVVHYSTGLKRNATLDPNLAKHPDGGVRLTVEDQSALVAFLKTLTDARFETNMKTATKTP